MIFQDSIGVAAVLNHNVAESKIDRFNKPLQPMEAQTYGFKGFPEMHMMEPKRPLRHQPSADITTDVNRYFRKDSPPDWLPPPEPMQPRMQSPPRQQRRQSPPRQERENDFGQGKMDSPQLQLQGTLSPRYNTDQQMSRRKTPVIRDPLGELSYQEKQKKIEEHYQAEEDLAMAQRRREEQKMAKIQEQRRPRFGDENRGMDGVRSSMEQRHDMPGRKEEMLEEQAKQLKHVQDELSRLRAQDDMSYGAPRGMPDYNPRAQSDVKAPPPSIATSPMCIFKATPCYIRKMNLVGYLYSKEPQTDRPYRANRDRAYFGQSDQRVPDYLNVSPRRKPVGQLYNKDSTYKTDFDLPTVRHGNHNLGNPNKELWEPFSPFGLEGGGAPMVDSSGQRKTRIAGSMGILGREASDSARARKARGHKKEMLDTISAQAANDRLRKEYEKESRRQQYCELSDVMRQQKVGYPKYKPSGIIDNHHLPHMFETGPVVKPSEKKELYDYLTKQVNEKYMHDQLGTMEGRRQAIEHYKTQDRFFGRRGGGNIKGDDLRKVNLDRAIHNPTSTSRYYNKVRLEEELSPPEILDKFKPRITINSTHKNLYEFPEGNLKGIDVRNYMGQIH